jgi:hypothetical protein
MIERRVSDNELVGRCTSMVIMIQKIKCYKNWLSFEGGTEIHCCWYALYKMQVMFAPATPRFFHFFGNPQDLLAEHQSAAKTAI